MPKLKILRLSGALTSTQLVSIANPSLEHLRAYTSDKVTHETLLRWNVPPNLATLHLVHSEFWTPRGMGHFVHDLPSMSLVERKLYVAVDEFNEIINEYRQQYEKNGRGEQKIELMDELQYNCKADAGKLLAALAVLVRDKEIRNTNANAVYEFLFRFCGVKISELDRLLTPEVTQRMKQSQESLRESFEIARDPNRFVFYPIAVEISR